MVEKHVKQLELDIRGQVCPSTLLTTLKEISCNSKAIRAGEICLMVKTDARDATGTIPQMVKNMGYAVNVLKQDGYYCIMVGKDV